MLNLTWQNKTEFNVKWPLRSLKVTYFGVSVKAARDWMIGLLYNNVGNTTKASKEIASESTKNCRFRQPHCRLTDAPLQEKPPSPVNIRTNLTLPETRVVGLRLRCW